MDNDIPTWLGLKLRYCNQLVTVVEENETYILICFESGCRIATPKSGFDKKDIK